MKADQAAVGQHGPLVDGDVAHANERLGVVGDQVVIQQIHYSQRRESAGDCNHGVDGWIGKHGVNIIGLLLGRPAGPPVLQVHGGALPQLEPPGSQELLPGLILRLP